MFFLNDIIKSKYKQTYNITNGGKMSKHDKKMFVDKKPYIAFFVIVITVLTYILLASAHREITAIREKRELTEKFVLENGTKLIENAFVDSASELTFLKETVEEYIAYGYNPEHLLLDFSKNSPNYAQIRIIDEYGYEDLSIRNYKIPVVIENKDYNYSEDTLFYKTRELSHDSMYVSEFDLYTINGEIESRTRTTLRFCMPLYVNNRFYGIIVLNYSTDDLFSDLNDIAHSYDSNLDLLNDGGYWINSTSNTANFEYLFNEKNAKSFNNIYDDEWNTMVRSKPNEIQQIYTHDGLFTYNKLDFTSILNKDIYTIGEIVFEEPVAYLVAYTLKNAGNGRVFTDYKLENYLYMLSDKFLYLIFIFALASLTTALIYFRDVSLRKIKVISEYDALTGAYNRRAGMELAEDILNSGNTDHLPTTICFVDINGLKEVNDNIGHQFGDELIITATQIIKQKLKKNDIFMRVGGDEFIIILFNTSKDDAEKWWTKVEEHYKFINLYEGRAYNISLSHGAVEYTYKDASHLEKTIDETDKIMYENKKLMKRNFHSLKNKQPNNAKPNNNSVMNIIDNKVTEQIDEALSEQVDEKVEKIVEEKIKEILNDSNDTNDTNDKSN